MGFFQAKILKWAAISFSRGSSQPKDWTHLSCLAGRFFAQSCLWDPMDCKPPGSPVHGILQARILEWIVISFSRGSSQLRDQTWVSCFAGKSFCKWVCTHTHTHTHTSPHSWASLPSPIPFLWIITEDWTGLRVLYSSFHQLSVLHMAMHVCQCYSVDLSHLLLSPLCPKDQPLHLSVQFSSVQSLSRVRLFATPWITARQASLSITNSWSSLRLTSIESVIQPSPLLSSPSPPAPNPSQHQSLFQWVNSLHEVAKVLKFQL